MTLKEAIKILGGVREAAAVAGVPRTSIYYWLENPPPAWRLGDIKKIIDAAQEIVVAHDKGMRAAK